MTESRRESVYQEVTERILEQGRVPWAQPWGRAKAKAGVGLPRNAGSGRPYSGINILILWGAVIERGYSVQSWLTFRQALALGDPSGHRDKSAHWLA
ncbi:ArdC-like ssDNA-binding domain-containing protein [Shumkonia mesophila]|uniref:ArdC-like ssDNA-binding domain-containing protein n=1 Tax=Shumkonia mesophila TaxID=2838854 RepID=UPI0037436D17